MKKSLLTLAIAGIIGLVYCTSVEAAVVSVTKPSVKVNTSQEQAALNKAKSDINAKQNAVKNAPDKAKADEKQANQKII